MTLIDGTTHKLIKIEVRGKDTPYHYQSICLLSAVDRGRSTAYDIANMPPYGDVDAIKVDSSGGDSTKMKEEEKGE